MKWRKERDEFFKNHTRSPLLPKDKEKFRASTTILSSGSGLLGRIERYIFHINNPKYYATFLTNKGTNKRYIRYGRFHLELNGKEHSLEIYKSILSDNLFIPFNDRTNGKETYGGGRYLDAEILKDYKMVLDFNMAYHPSCAYNDKFVCALLRKRMCSISKSGPVRETSSNPSLQAFRVYAYGKDNENEDGYAACCHGDGHAHE